jgi:hypothetical protein
VQKLTPTQQAIEAFKGVKSVADFQRLIAQYSREVLEDAADMQDSQHERVRARRMLEAVPPQSAAINCLEIAPTASAIVDEEGFHRLIRLTDQQQKRLGWSSQQAREFLLTMYGKRSRHLLTNEEMLDFYDYLKTLPTPDSSSSG